MISALYGKKWVLIYEGLTAVSLVAVGSFFGFPLIIVVKRLQNVRRRDILKELEWVGPSRPTDYVTTKPLILLQKPN